MVGSGLFGGLIGKLIEQSGLRFDIGRHFPSPHGAALAELLPRIDSAFSTCQHPYSSSYHDEFASAIGRNWRRRCRAAADIMSGIHAAVRSEEHTSELQSLMRNSYSVFCLKKKKQN